MKGLLAKGSQGSTATSVSWRGLGRLRLWTDQLADSSPWASSLRTMRQSASVLQAAGPEAAVTAAGTDSKRGSLAARRLWSKGCSLPCWCDFSA